MRHPLSFRRQTAMQRAMNGSSRLTVLLEQALAAAAAGEGRQVAPVSLTVDFAAAGSGEPAVAARVERATRSLVFAAGEARWPDGRAAATAQAVFRVAGS